MTLPFPPHRSHLSGFWIGVHLLGCLAAAALWAGQATRPWSMVLLATLVGTFLLGLLRRSWILFAYRAWNRLVRLMGRAQQGWVLIVLHRVVLVMVRLAGPTLPLTLEGDTTWEKYGLDPRAQGQADAGGTLARRLLREARGLERGWWLGLLPFLLLLAWMAPEPEAEFEVPGNLYTLF